LIRQVILEGLTVSVIGGAIGVVASMWTTDFIVAAFPEDLPHWAQVRIDARVAVFAAAVSILATVMFALWPAFAVVASEPGRGF
jgi:ABC-type antimicrobial peptide transport system permease subunit